jgi:CHAD domain-containing protein
MKSRDANLQLLACRHLQKQTKILLAQIDGIRCGDDIEFVHQARVASRRIRAALGVFKAALPTKKGRRWNKHIRRLTKGLGTARDKDVQIAFVAQMVADQAPQTRMVLPGLRRLLLRLRQEREAVQPRVIHTLDQLDHAGVLAEMVVWTAKLRFSLRRTGTDVTSSSVVTRGARDIRRARDRLLKLQPCLDDAEAVPEHHQMRIAGKKLRYVMEIYKRAFEKRLDKAIKTVRSIQGLLGDIHDCDVWIEVIEEFIQEERQRTVEYYGHAAPFRRLLPGFEYLRDERTAHRKDTFDELVRLWKSLAAQGFWEEMLACLDASQTGAPPLAPVRATIHPEEHAPETAEAGGSHDREASGRTGGGMSQPESCETMNKRKGDSAPPDFPLRPGESQSCASAGEGAEVVAPASPPGGETTRSRGTQPAEEPAPRGRDWGYRTASDHSVARNAPSVAKAVCECCGENSFLPDELCKIDSGQLLCSGCLGAFQKKASES